jgi:GNAT superfamily N-acetyltransferase
MGNTHLRRFEEAGFNAWPALQTALLDGWVLRFAGGYTKRANSINPTYPGDVSNLAAKVDACEAIYRRRGLPSIFRLTSFGVPNGLDDLLASRGYTLADRTLVMHRELTGTSPSTALDVHNTPLEEWLDRYVALSGSPLDKRDTHAAMLRQIAGEPLFATLRDESGEPVACGLAVLEADLVGLFEIVTDRDKRLRGFGAALVTAMLAWAATQGATTSYLQVVAVNDPAVRLYRKLGFTDAYHYWYRLPPTSGIPSPSSP